MKEELRAAIATAVEMLFGIDGVPVEVTEAEAGFGDYASNVAFQLAGRLKAAPREVASKLAAAITHPQVDTVEAAGAGYINLTLKSSYWQGQLANIDDSYATSNAGHGAKLQVEFISANPTGPLTLGNARGGFIGDTLARVMGRQGYDVTREYYFNDAGTQIGKLVESVKAAAGQGSPTEVQYKGEYIDELAKEFQDDLGDKDDDQIGQLLTQAIFERFLKPAIERMGIDFDVWFNEKDLVTSGEFEAAVERLKQVDLYYEKDGAKWVATSKLGDERDRPVVKSNGDITYLGNDIAYHLNIFEKRGFDAAIKEWGADHAGQVPSLRLTLAKLLPDKRLDFVIHQFVRLMSAGQEAKMSKRAGTYVTTDELIDQVGPDVARFFFLMRSADSHMDFDLDLAKEESQKNPYWYVMYAYARANSILAKAAERGLRPGKALTVLDPLEVKLVKCLAYYPELLGEIAADYGVHRLTHFGMELAKLFHDWYEQVQVLSLEDEEARGKLYLLDKFTTFMCVYFDTLGIAPIERMDRE